MKNALLKFFYYPGTKRIYKEKLYSTILILLMFLTYIIYAQYRNKRKDKEREENKRYTIGSTIKLYKNFRSPNPTVKFSFNANGRVFKDFQEIPDSLHGLVNTEDGRYFVKFSTKDPSNCQLLLNYPVPDSIISAPANGWTDEIFLHKE